MIKKAVKNIYMLIPFKKNIFDIIKKVAVPPYNIYRYLVHEQAFSLRIKDKEFKLRHHGFHFYIENEFYWKGYRKSSFEPYSRELWYNLSEQSETIFDIGANTGLYSMIACVANFHSKIFSFEPIVRNAKKLIQNRELNNFNNIQVVQKAASNKNEVREIYTPVTDVSTISTLQKRTITRNKKEYKYESVNCVRLDDFVKSHQLHKIDLIKIDVEGFEFEVIEGCINTINRDLPTLIIELRIEEIATKIGKLFDGLDYLFFDINERTTPIQMDTLSKGSYNNVLICTPQIADKLNLLNS